MIFVMVFMYVITQDEKYLIIINGTDENFDELYDIHILNLYSMQWEKSNMKTDQVKDGNIILMDESLSTNELNYNNRMDLFINGLLRKLEINLHVQYHVILYIYQIKCIQRK